ncbi:CLUMA_CG000341, isoform A [Clunio marinus]|uniref:CLUMA_CG000341, isoform A n=1 Tax=Clunio marinus TaxID=568069 RepID=A0A1J1HEB3_9DIPT|nr:CLUMA_CG000341, isoform A [Clunio marinus]
MFPNVFQIFKFLAVLSHHIVERHYNEMTRHHQFPAMQLPEGAQSLNNPKNYHMEKHEMESPYLIEKSETLRRENRNETAANCFRNVKSESQTTGRTVREELEASRSKIPKPDYFHEKDSFNVHKKFIIAQAVEELKEEEEKEEKNRSDQITEMQVSVIYDYFTKKFIFSILCLPIFYNVSHCEYLKRNSRNLSFNETT